LVNRKNVVLKRLIKAGVFATVLLVVSFSLSGCGPVYSTHYTYSPPDDPHGKACVFQCENSKLQCQQIKDMEAMQCRDQAELRYRDCQRRNDRRREGEKRDNCYRTYCSSANYEQCEERYRACYQICGGEVVGEEVCTAFCD